MKNLDTMQKGGCAVVLIIAGYLFCGFVINIFSLLHHASKDGNLSKVVTMTRLGGHPEALSMDKFISGTPMHLAAEYGHIDIVEHYLKIGTDPNVRAQGGFTPLAVAARHGRQDIVRLLVESGARPDLADFKGRDTPLENAILSKDSAMVALMMELLQEHVPEWQPTRWEFFTLTGSGNSAVYSLVLPPALAAYHETFGSIVPPVEATVEELIDLFTLGVDEYDDVLREAFSRELPGTAAFMIQYRLALSVDSERPSVPIAVFWCITVNDKSALRKLAESGYPLDSAHPRHGTPIEFAVKREQKGMELILREYLEQDSQ